MADYEEKEEELEIDPDDSKFTEEHGESATCVKLRCKLSIF